MSHWLIIEKVGNKHVSESSTPVTDLPAHLEVVDVVSRPDWSQVRWDAATRTLMSLPPAPAPLNLAAELSTIKTALGKKPDKKVTAPIDAVLAKADAVWTNADIAAVLRWVVSAVREV